MQTVRIDLDEDLVTLLHAAHESLEYAAKELMVLELYRRGTVSSGKAAELLGMSRLAFINHAFEVGIPFFDMTDQEWEAERRLIETL